MTQYSIPIKAKAEPIEVTKIERRTRLFLMDGSTIDTPLTMPQIEYFLRGANSSGGTSFLRTVSIDKSGKLHSELISYGFLARVTNLQSYKNGNSQV